MPIYTVAPNRSKTEVTDEIRTIRRGISRGKVAGVFDWDGTMTNLQYDQGIPITQWAMLDKELPEQVQEEMGKIRQYYIGLMKSGEMTQEDELAWVIKCVEVYIQHITDINIFSCSRKVKVRPIIRLLMAMIGMSRCAIISYGLKNFIEHALNNEFNRLHSLKRIYAVELLSKDGDIFTDYSRDQIVLWTNKGVFLDRFRREPEIEGCRIIVFGDSTQDASMMKEDTFNVLIAKDPRKVDYSKFPNLHIVIEPKKLRDFYRLIT